MALLAASAAWAAWAAASARADARFSARLGTGGGAALVRGSPADGLFEARLVADLLLGARRADHVRAGPFLDVRTGDFTTFEAALGGTLALPLGGSFVLAPSVGVGLATRRREDDGALGLARLWLGYRPYNYLFGYGYGLGFYVDARAGLGGPARWEITGGVEVDLQFVIGIPILFLYTWLSGGDPDEAGDDERPERNL